jgi:hypothetical protein
MSATGTVLNRPKNPFDGLRHARRHAFRFPSFRENMCE